MSILQALASDVIPEWQERANCDGVPTDFFYPEKGQTATAALRVCRGCDLNVKAECLQWALDNNERGIWGGTTEQERRKMRRQQGVAA